MHASDCFSASGMLHFAKSGNNVFLAKTEECHHEPTHGNEAFSELIAVCCLSTSQQVHSNTSFPLPRTEQFCSEQV